MKDVLRSLKIIAAVFAVALAVGYCLDRASGAEQAPKLPQSTLDFHAVAQTDLPPRPLKTLKQRLDELRKGPHHCALGAACTCGCNAGQACRCLSSANGTQRGRGELSPTSQASPAPAPTRGSTPLAPAPAIFYPNSYRPGLGTRPASGPVFFVGGFSGGFGGGCAGGG